MRYLRKVFVIAILAAVAAISAVLGFAYIVPVSVIIAIRRKGPAPTLVVPRPEGTRAVGPAGIEDR